MNQPFTKAELRDQMRAARREHVNAQPDSVRGLLFNHPPRPILGSIPQNAVIGLYHATSSEAPAAAYAQFFQENGHTLALPRFASPEAPMRFAVHTDAFAESDLESGPFGLSQPGAAAPSATPDVHLVPVIAFNTHCQRLGQGGGHYDRWLAEHPDVKTIGLAWDVQLIEPADALPTEPHDIKLDAVVTPTRMYGNL
ncbi:MAG: 5-formyltetrahydrofolate cyclo-ligase [Pseudomonadota bacterium]